MRIASITVTKDDYHTFEQWLSHYQAYKDEIYLHIIVDNGSSDDYKKKIKKEFTDSVIIERDINGGTTAAYNDGIKRALTDPDVDSIALIAQDIKFDDDALPKLHQLLFSDDKHGLVGPVLCKADSNRIEAYGTEIKKNLMINRLYNNCFIDYPLPEVMEVDLVPGGANIAKREVYEKVGLQDESLFMYGDETDYDLRIKLAGYKLLVTTCAIAWHQHINISSLKYGSGTVFYYNNRNIIFLNYRYSSFFMALNTFCYLFFWRGPRYFVGFLMKAEFKKIILYFTGLLAGLLNFRRNWV
jgi:hypothetical protein